MSECIKNCKLCNKLILSTSVSFTNSTLVINLPEGNYANNCKYCIVIAQAIPDSVTINAPVVFTIGGEATTYPFVNKDCTPILANQVRTRKVYPTRVNTGVATGVFKYIGNQCLPATLNQVIPSIPTE